MNPHMAKSFCIVISLLSFVAEEIMRVVINCHIIVIGYISLVCLLIDSFV